MPVQVTNAGTFYSQFGSLNRCYQNATYAADMIIKAAPEKYRADDAVTRDKLVGMNFTALALAESMNSTTAVSDIFAMARDGKPLLLSEMTEDGLRTQTGDVARSLDAIAKIEKGIKRSRDAQATKNATTQVVAGVAMGPEITFGYNDLVLPGAQPEFGKQTMELAGLNPFGEVKVNGDMDGGFGQVTDGLDAQTRRIAMFSVEYSSDPWTQAVASHQGYDRARSLADYAERLINERIGMTVYLGQSAFGWKGIKDIKSIAASSLTLSALTVDQTVASVLEQIRLYTVDNLNRFPATNVQLSLELMSKLEGTMSSNALSGIEYLRKTRPEITFTQEVFLNQIESSLNHLVITHKATDGGGRPHGLQGLWSRTNLIYPYTQGLTTKTLRVRLYAGLHIDQPSALRVVSYTA